MVAPVIVFLGSEPKKIARNAKPGLCSRADALCSIIYSGGEGSYVTCPQEING